MNTAEEGYTRNKSTPSSTSNLMIINGWLVVRSLAKTLSTFNKTAVLYLVIQSCCHEYILLTFTAREVLASTGSHT